MRIENYLENERVKRGSISQHIKLKKISCSELETLINDPRIKRGFVGEKFQNKKPQADWTREYLDALVYEAVAGAFNADYLRYLFEVAQYVNSQTSDDSGSVGKNKDNEETWKEAAKGVLHEAKNGVKKAANVVKRFFRH